MIMVIMSMMIMFVIMFSTFAMEVIFAEPFFDIGFAVACCFDTDI